VLPSIAEAVGCAYVQTYDLTASQTLCDPSNNCAIQNLRQIKDSYTQTGFNNRWFQPRETRNWWERSSPDVIVGLAHTEWNENVSVKCDYTDATRWVFAEWNPDFGGTARTPDYVWNEALLPAISPPAQGNRLFYWTQTPTSVSASNLYTQLVWTWGAP
jgi:hypothetical protein